MKTADTRIQFAPETGGFPSRVSLRKNVIIETQLPFLSVKLGDGRTGRPFVPDDYQPVESASEEPTRLTYPKIGWQDENCELLEDFYLSLTYELWQDGTVFVDAFFLVENTDAPALSDLRLEIPLRLPVNESLRWGFLGRPAKFDATTIQSARIERFLAPGLDREFPGQIIPQFSFDGKDDSGVGYHLEFFVEGHSTLSGKVEDAATEVRWQEGGPVLSWNFQAAKRPCRERPWQWRNRWGWLLTAAPTERRLPPLRMYQYFDNYERYPSDRQLDKIAAAGADVLILHENWRLDAQNGGIPYDCREFQRTVDRAHEHNIRVAVYIRGNEDSATKDACSWFDGLLRKDFDGLYMDYGSPFNAIRPADEGFPGGRIDFRSHFATVRRLRERVGKDGLLFSHTGPGFSALGMTGGTVNGYISGEGERGIVIQNRLHHDYFSAAYAAMGTMWTAAFPEYGSARMLPFLAATGQYPHNPLGTQFANSSLSHPRDPGINDVYLRPLWKLWGLFRQERDIEVCNDYNCEGVLSSGDADIGKNLMLAGDKESALLVVANFSDAARSAEIRIDWDKTAFRVDDDVTCVLLRPGLDSPGEATAYDCSQGVFQLDLDGCAVAGFYLSRQPDRLRSLLNEFERPYPPHDETNRAYEERIARQKQLRQTPPGSKKLFLSVEVANLAVPYEESMWWDLFENAFQIGTFAGDGDFEPIGWISSEGLVQEEPKREEYIWPGHQSPWIELHSLLAPGKHELGIHSIHFGEPFYSFIRAVVSPEPNRTAAGAYAVEFLNELEDDRSFLRFNVDIRVDP